MFSFPGRKNTDNLSCMMYHLAFVCNMLCQKVFLPISLSSTESWETVAAWLSLGKVGKVDDDTRTVVSRVKVLTLIYPLTHF